MNTKCAAMEILRLHSQKTYLQKNFILKPTAGAGEVVYLHLGFIIFYVSQITKEANDLKTQFLQLNDSF